MEIIRIRKLWTFWHHALASLPKASKRMRNQWNWLGPGKRARGGEENEKVN